jgi:hypothetical protein
MNHEEYRAILQSVENALVRSRIPKDRAWAKPWAERNDYRGKRRCLVGYSWSKRHSSLSRGRVYDAVLGYGDTFDEALAMMRARQAAKQGQS